MIQQFLLLYIFLCLPHALYCMGADSSGNLRRKVFRARAQEITVVTDFSAITMPAMPKPSRRTPMSDFDPAPPLTALPFSALLESASPLRFSPATPQPTAYRTRKRAHSAPPSGNPQLKTEFSLEELYLQKAREQAAHVETLKTTTSKRAAEYLRMLAHGEIMQHSRPYWL